MNVEEARQLPKEDPLTYKYVIYIKYILNTMAAWPNARFGDKKESLVLRVLRKYLPIQTVIVLFGQSNYIKLHRHEMNFNSLIHCYITTFLGAMSIARSGVSNFDAYGKTLEFLFNTFYLAHFVNKGKAYQEMNALVNKVSHYFTVYMIGLLLIGTLLYNVEPISTSYFKGAFHNIGANDTPPMEFPITYAYPGFEPADHYVFVYIFGFYLAYVCAVGICLIDTLLYLMVFQIIGHISVLRNNLKMFPKPAKHSTLQLQKDGQQISLEVEMYSEDEHQVVHDYLVESVRHHILITNFAEEVSTFFGTLLGLNYGYHTVCCCLLLLQLADSTAPKVRFIPIAMMTFGQLMQVSIIFEIVNTVSDDLKEACYDIPWECMNTRNRRTMSIFLHRLQTPITVTAMGLTTVGVNTMASILKTTISYFAFLKSVAD